MLTELKEGGAMPYKQAAEQRQELPSRSIPRRRSQYVPAGRMHAIDAETREVACGINAAGLYVFDRDWTSGIAVDRCPACLEATGYGRPLEPPPGPTTP